ncbi:MAG: hypothetical protein EBS34_10790 [Flavobacteriales bacterium]|nr:hypothetical protein [Flavobacteriales bacterium]
MAVKIALLKSGESLISDIKELVSNDDKVCGYILKEPHRVSVRTPILLTEEEDHRPEGKTGLEVVFSPWIILTDDKEMLIPSDWVVTLVDPLASVKEMYFDKLKTYIKNGGKENE